MLQNIRDKLQGTVAKVIIALIAVPFAVFGIDAFFSGSAPDAARVNGEAISCLLYTSPSPRDRTRSRLPSSAWKKKTTIDSTHNHIG